MITVVLVVHLLLAIALVGVVLIQRSEGGALGMGGGGMSGFLTGRSTANLLTRSTAVLAALFIVTSLTLAKLAGGDREARSILDQPPGAVQEESTEPQSPAAPVAR
jgi:preprotein translocase subunit SecG